MVNSKRAHRPRGGRKAPRRGSEGGSHPHWIYGRHPVLAALDNPARRIQRLLVTRDAEAALPGNCRAETARPEVRSGTEIAALLPEGALHQGFAALCQPLPPLTLDQVLTRLEGRERACVLVLDQVTDPRNTGAILRSAAALGAVAVIVPERRSPAETAVMAKAASGALEAVDLVRVTNIARALESLKAALTGRIALVLGSEGGGLRRLVAKTCDHLAALPMRGPMESLNVSAAAAIALYEAARQTGD
jgi:23S rRNA (guanosine2251-2'-O)-methyltransferase